MQECRLCPAGSFFLSYQVEVGVIAIERHALLIFLGYSFFLTLQHFLEDSVYVSWSQFQIETVKSLVAASAPLRLKLTSTTITTAFPGIGRRKWW